jgi:protein O-GlcNAc transferase
VHDKTDLQVAQLLREKEIDIAIDLAGYTEHCRPGIFMHHAAPIQVQYLGFPGTTGAPYMDYMIVDKDIAPPEQEPFFSEKVVIMPDTYQVTDGAYKITLPLPTRQQVGLPETGFVFCCFNVVNKITPTFFEIWMRLLSQVDGSFLWLLGSNDDAISNLREAAKKYGLDPARLIFAPPVTQDEHKSRLRLADLVLDTQPYNAHTTASDALLAGVPLVTCIGKSFAARVAAGILRAAQMPELITDNLQDYENLALKIAQTPELLKEMRDKLASNLNTCPLFDTDRFRRHLESAYITMLQRYENDERPSRLIVEPIF